MVLGLYQSDDFKLVVITVAVHSTPYCESAHGRAFGSRWPASAACPHVEALGGVRQS